MAQNVEIVEVTLPEMEPLTTRASALPAAGRTLRELDLRNKKHITVLLLRKPESAEEQIPGPDAILESGDALTVFGNREEIVTLFKKEG